MAISIAVKDYIELMHNQHFPQVFVPVHVLLPKVLLFVLSTVKHLFVYLLSFQWFRDLTSLTVEMQTFTVADKYFIKELSTDRLYEFLQPVLYANNNLLVGFLNSFFLCLPLSVVNLVTVRRLWIQGIPAAIASASGAVLAHWLFTTLVLFGLRSLVTPWFSFEPFTYIAGLCLIINCLYDMATQRSFSLIRSFERAKLFRISFLSFALSWTEQSCIFQHLSGLTFTPQASPLGSLAGNNFLSNFNYSVGLLIGCVFFTTVFGFLTLWLRGLLTQAFGITVSRFVKISNRWLLIITFAFAYTSIPYYGIDYLLANPMSFLSRDKALKDTFFTPTLATLKEKEHVKMESLVADLAAFDRGIYLLDSETLDSVYEQVRYHGDKAYNDRIYRALNLSRSQKSRKRNWQSGSREFVRGTALKSSVEADKKKKDSIRAYLKEVRKEITHWPLKLKDERVIQGRKSEVGQKIENETDPRVEAVLQGVLYIDKLEEAKRDDTHKFKITRESQEKLEAKAEKSVKPALETFRFDEVVSDSTLEEPTHSFLPIFQNNYLYNTTSNLLLRTDIDLFIRRQPKNFKPSLKQELDLWKRRGQAVRYANSLFAYQRMPGSLRANKEVEIVGGLKSYASGPYSQQFKGTLSCVRRLFSTTLSDIREERDTKKGMLKFDQPLLYDDDRSRSKKGLFLREKPVNDPSTVQMREKGLYHEEIEPRVELSLYPFLRRKVPGPVYAGWDNNKRKLVFTNQYLPREIAGDKVLVRHSFRDYLEQQESKGYRWHTTGMHNKHLQFGPRQEMHFVSWPLAATVNNMVREEVKDTLSVKRQTVKAFFKEKQTKLAKFLYPMTSENNFSFVLTSPPGYDFYLQDIHFYEPDLDLDRDDPRQLIKQYPTFLKQIDSYMETVPPPNRGGFMWPGFSRPATEEDNK